MQYLGIPPIHSQSAFLKTSVLAASGSVNDTREWWLEKLTWEPDDYGEGETPYAADTDNLLRFLKIELRNWFETRHKELSNRPLIREQAFGESLDPGKLERLGRYEVHLDRKLERTLTMLIRLQDLRRGVAEG